MKRPLVIYDFAPDPYYISLYMRKIFFSFLSVYSLRISENIVTIKAMTLIFITAQTVRKKVALFSLDPLRMH